MPPLDRMYLWLATAAMLAGCQLSLDHAACPCADGWVCCASTQVCVIAPTECPGEEPEVQRLSLDQPWLSDKFGSAVALVGDRAAVGLPGGDQAASNGGAVVVFERRGSGTGVWVRVAVITAPDPSPNAGFGTALAFVGSDLLVIGAPHAGDDHLGRVYVFRRGVDGWSSQHTIAPDLTGVARTKGALLSFGNVLASDGDRVIIGADDSIAHVVQVTTSSVAHLARLTAFPSPEGASFPTGVAIHGSMAELHELYRRGVYVFDEALGWAPQRVADLPISSFFPRAVAFDGERMAIPGQPGVVRIFQRTASGWDPGTDVVLPTEPRAWMPMTLTWRASDLVMTTRLYGADVLGMSRVRSVGTAWQPDPITGRTLAAPEWMPLAVASDRALIGIPYAGTAASGTAMVFGLDDTGFVEQATLTIDDRPTITSIAGDDQHILLKGLGEQVGWFTRDVQGQYHAKPSLVLDHRSRLGARASVSGSHALASLHADSGLPAGVQPFELGDRDWVAAPLLTAPDDGFSRFPADTIDPIAVDGDTAVIGADKPAPSQSVVLVYTWKGGWQHTATLPAHGCSPSVAIAGAWIATFCAGNLRMFHRVGELWTLAPSPSLTVGRPTYVYRVLLSGDRAVVVTGAATGSTGALLTASEVFRWTDGAWHNERYLEFPLGGPGGGIGALAGDRMVAYRDPTSVTPYRFVDGAWREQSPLTLPFRPRSPDASIRDIVVTDQHAIVSVAFDDGDAARPQGAVYALPWR